MNKAVSKQRIMTFVLAIFLCFACETTLSEKNEAEFTTNNKVNLNKEMANNIINMAYAYNESGQIDEGILCMVSGIRMIEQESTEEMSKETIQWLGGLYQYLGNMYYQQKRFEETIISYKKALYYFQYYQSEGNYPDQWYAEYYLVLSYFAINDFDSMMSVVASVYDNEEYRSYRESFPMKILENPDLGYIKECFKLYDVICVYYQEILKNDFV